MNIQTALLPHKHLKFSASLIAIAGAVRMYLSEPRTIDELWALIESNKPHSNIKPTFTQLVLAVDILFVIQQITANDDGRIVSSAIVQEGELLCD